MKRKKKAVFMEYVSFIRSYLFSCRSFAHPRPWNRGTVWWRTAAFRMRDGLHPERRHLHVRRALFISRRETATECCPHNPLTYASGQVRWIPLILGFECVEKYLNLTGLMAQLGCGFDSHTDQYLCTWTYILVVSGCY